MPYRTEELLTVQHDEKQKALMVEGMKLVIWNHQELKSN